MVIVRIGFVVQLFYRDGVNVSARHFIDVTKIDTNPAAVFGNVDVSGSHDVCDSCRSVGGVDALLVERDGHLGGQTRLVPPGSLQDRFDFKRLIGISRIADVDFADF